MRTTNLNSAKFSQKGMARKTRKKVMLVRISGTIRLVNWSLWGDNHSFFQSVVVHINFVDSSHIIHMRDY